MVLTIIYTKKSYNNEKKKAAKNHTNKITQHMLKLYAEDISPNGATC